MCVLSPCAPNAHSRTHSLTHHDQPLPLCTHPHTRAVGCGGKPGEPGSGLDALDNKYIEAGSFYCADPKVLDKTPNAAQPVRCASYQPALGGFCWTEQPPFSAYREAAFGHGMLTLINATHAEWTWDQNNNKAGFEDYVILNRGEPGDCGKRREERLASGL